MRGGLRGWRRGGEEGERAESGEGKGLEEGGGVLRGFCKEICSRKLAGFGPFRMDVVVVVVVVGGGGLFL